MGTIAGIGKRLRGVGIYRYYIHAYEDARQKRPIKHEHGGTTILTDGAEALGRAELLSKEFPDGWVYLHVEYRAEKQ